MQVSNSPATPLLRQVRVSGAIKAAWVLFLLCALNLAWNGSPLQAADVLRLGVPSAGPTAFDPHKASGTDTIVADMVFNALLRYQPGNCAVIEADLAESVPKPKMVGGKQVWTFTLKKGVMFQAGPKNKGYELTSEDVLYSLEKAADPNRCAYAANYAGMSFKRLGPSDIQVVLDRPLSAAILLPRFVNRGGGYIVSRKAVKAMGDDRFNAWPVGTGPFAFSADASGQGVKLMSHKAYFRGKPCLDGVEVVYQPDSAACEQGFLSGDLSVIGGLRSAAWVNKAKLWDKTVVDVFGPGETLGLVFKSDRRPLNDKRVRMALVYALNRQEFVDIFGPSVAQTIYAPVPPGLSGGLGPSELKPLDLDYETDLVKARALLKETGYEHGFTLEIVRVEHSGDQHLYEVLQRQLKRIGINVVLTAVAANGAQTPKDTGMSLAFFRWAEGTNADDILMKVRSALSNDASPAQADYGKLDTLLEAARRETGAKKRHEIWRHAQMKMLQDMVYYPIGIVRYVTARRAEVDYGYTLTSAMTPCPPITEKTRLLR